MGRGWGGLSTTGVISMGVLSPKGVGILERMGIPEGVDTLSIQ